MGKSRDKIRVSFKDSGAAEDVTGSCTTITWGKPETTILVDCGLIQGGTSLLKEYQANSSKFTFKEKEVKYLFITHMHGDHAFRSNLLVKRGFRGKIIIPEGSRELFKAMNLDCARILERNALDLSKKLKKDYPPIFTEDDVYKTMELVEEYPIDKKIVLNEELTFEFIPSGHIINACQLVLYIKNGNSIKKLGFTGDLGNIKVPNYYCNTFKPIQNANLLVGECTYANQDRSVKVKDREKDLEKIKTAIYDTCVFGDGKILFPSFSLMRSQVMLTILYEIFHDDETFNVPIYVASPLTCKVNSIFDEILEGEQLKQWTEARKWSKVHFIDNFEKLEEVVAKKEPMIFIASSGMLQAGYSVYLAEKLLPGKKNTIIFIGFSVEGSLAYKIKQKKTKTVNINGHPVPSRCKVLNLASFSSHMQYDELCKYYSGGMGTGVYGKVVLNHGNMQDRISFAKVLREEISKRNRTDKVIVANKSLEILL